MHVRTHVHVVYMYICACVQGHTFFVKTIIKLDTISCDVVS